MTNRLEEMEGKDLAIALKNDPNIAPTPLIMLSSCDQPMTRQALKKIGIEDFLTKPLREKRLYSTIVKTLSMIKSLRKPAFIPVQEQVSESSPIASSSMETENIEILVAEDFALNQDVVRLMLSGSDYTPVFADNGQIAVDLYKADPDRFRLILMDVSMPKMDGHQATGEILAFETENGLTHTPIIALTGHALKHDRQKCFDAGMDDYLTKPVKQEALMVSLKKWVATLDAESIAA